MPAAPLAASAMTADLSLGIDFGTTNTVLALAACDGPARLVRFAAPGGELFAFRSALSIQAPPDRPGERDVAAGPWAIDAYADDPHETRFIQSFKTFAASRSFTETQVLARRYRFEDLLSTFLLKLRDQAGADLAARPRRVVVGRPVRFAGGAPDEALALARYDTAFRRLGFEDVRYAYEPVGAAFYFARELRQDAVVLVGDFGGGTSDFSIIRFAREAGQVKAEPLGRAGVGVAGDAFDFRILDALVSPSLGKGSTYTSLGKTLPVPSRYYAAFARWDQLAMMQTSREFREIKSLVRQADEPDKLRRFAEAIEENYGYALYRAVSELKVALSRADVATFTFDAGSIHLRQEVSRATFEGWITPELAQIGDAVDAALADANLPASAVDRVFLTGGSSLVPAVRRLFYDRFEADRIATGAELESIASGLALIGRETDLDRWTVRAPDAA